MSAFEVIVNVIRGAETVLRKVCVPVLASDKNAAMTQAERLVNKTTDKTEWGEAQWVRQIFPPPPGPTAVAA